MARSVLYSSSGEADGTAVPHGWKGCNREYLVRGALMKPLRTCKTCGVEAFETNDLPYLFMRGSSSKHGYQNKCVVCHRYASNRTPEAKLAKSKYQCARRYGVSIEEYEQNMATSDCCEICERTDNLCYDHCHATMKFRGILCRSCNAAIGHLGDNLEGVQRAVVYLTNKGHT